MHLRASTWPTFHVLMPVTRALAASTQELPINPTPGFIAMFMRMGLSMAPEKCV